MVCCTLLYVHSSIAIILMGRSELVALLNLSSWCLVMVEWLFPAVPWGCLQFVIVVFPDHTHLLFSIVANHYVFGAKRCNLYSRCSMQYLVRSRVSYIGGPNARIQLIFSWEMWWWGGGATEPISRLNYCKIFLFPNFYGC